MQQSPKSHHKPLNSGRRRGSVLVECVIVLSLIMTPLLLGITTIGLNFVRALQVNQVNRDAGHMFARGVPFPVGSINREVIYQMAPRLRTTDSTGTAVLILSEVQFIGPNTCTGCANLNYVVFRQQITLGNPSLKASVFGDVPTASIDTDGTVKNPTTDLSARASGVQTFITLADGDRAYIAESYFSSADLSIPGFPSPPGVYARAIF
jgi:hypothetical protein